MPCGRCPPSYTLFPCQQDYFFFFSLFVSLFIVLSYCVKSICAFLTRKKKLFNHLFDSKNYRIDIGNLNTWCEMVAHDSWFWRITRELLLLLYYSYCYCRILHYNYIIIIIIIVTRNTWNLFMLSYSRPETITSIDIWLKRKKEKKRETNDDDL